MRINIKNMGSGLRELGKTVGQAFEEAGKAAGYPVAP